MRSLQRFVVVLSILVLSLAAFGQELNTAGIDQALGRSGQKSGEVYKLSFPRTDLHVVASGVAIKPGLALGSWAAFSGTDEKAVVMGDLVLLQGEVNPVMKKLRDAGFEITAVHNHLLDENPRLMYMHYMGEGNSRQLAISLHEALSASKTPLETPASAAANSETPAWVKAVQDSVGRQGSFKGGVLAFAVPRSNAITTNGMTITPAQGVAESINFQEAAAGNVATTGDFVLTADEVNAVISALEKHGIDVTALHSHMLKEEPRLFFMHFWGLGSAEVVGGGIKAALANVSTQ
jgi:biotin operon repressor